ncbi:MAG: DsbA family protein [Ginsengibacter sp.]
MLGKSETLIESKDIIIGNPAAQVTITAFIDYESRKSAEANEMVKNILTNFAGKVKLNFRHFPLMHIHQKALKAAEAAVAAAQEGKFLEMHEMLFANQKHLGIISLKSYAKEVGITNKSFLNNLVNGKYGVYVQDDLKYGIRLGVKEVPVLFINGKKLEGEITQASLTESINAVLKQ